MMMILMTEQSRTRLLSYFELISNTDRVASYNENVPSSVKCHLWALLIWANMLSFKEASYVALQVNFTHLMLKQPHQQDTHKAIQLLHH